MNSAIIVAAGSGQRMGGRTRKQYVDLSGQPVLKRTLSVFTACEWIDTTCLVVPPDDIDYCRKNFVDTDRIICVPGGRERQDSVYSGLHALQNKCEIVVIHDGVRPFVHEDQLIACIRGAQKYGACVVGVPARDTLKRVDTEGEVMETLDRTKIWHAQTPQAFRYDLILQAHTHARKKNISGTDDAFLVECFGRRVRMIEGRPDNIKITSPQDLKTAEAILRNRVSR